MLYFIARLILVYKQHGASVFPVDVVFLPASGIIYGLWKLHEAQKDPEVWWFYVGVWILLAGIAFIISRIIYVRSLPPPKVRKRHSDKTE